MGATNGPGRFLRLITAVIVFASLIPCCCNGQWAIEHGAETATLKFVHAIWRHGDRTPTVLIPSDTANNITTWPQGLGEITREGLAQQYRLGQFLRQRYDGFLSRGYSPFEVFVRSSDYNRTLTSAQANMAGGTPLYSPETATNNERRRGPIQAGLFPPLKEERFIPELDWRPLPVHTIPKEEDRFLYDKVLCPRATREEERIYDSPEVKRIEAANREMLEFFAKKGRLDKVPLPLREVWQLFDPLNSELHHPDEHQLPSWVNATIREEIWRLYEVSSSYLFGSDLLARLRGGPLLGEILQRMQSVAAGKHDSREKFYAYSAHDDTLAGFLAALGIRPAIFPLYATMLLIELHRDAPSGQYHVRLYHRNETDSSALWELEIPGCGTVCTLPQLIDATQKEVPVDWHSECGLHAWYHFTSGTYTLTILLLVLTCLALLVELVLLNTGTKGGAEQPGMAYRRLGGSSPSARLLLDPEAGDES